MTLEDKLGTVHVGDVLSLKNTEEQLEVVGFVEHYSTNNVRLSTSNPYNTSKGAGVLSWFHVSADNSRTYKLKYFDDYEVLRSYKDSIAE